MRLMAHVRWVGLRSDHCRRRAVSVNGLRDVLVAEVRFHNTRSVGRRVCGACLEGLPSVERKEFVHATPLKASKPHRRARPQLLVSQ